MITKISLKWVRWISESFALKEWLNVFNGKNGTGKSTVIQSISDAIRWEKIQVKEWEMTLEYDGLIVSRNANRLFTSPKIDIDITLPGFLMGKHKLIKGVNTTQEERRKTVSNLLGIDRTKFFLDNKVDYDLVGLTSELRDLNTRSSTYTEQLCELESQKIPEVKKPKEITFIPSTLDNFIKGNSDQLKFLKEQLSSIDPYKEVLEVPPMPAEIIFQWEKIINEWNSQEYILLSEQLEDIISQWKNVPSRCSTCWQDILDAEKVKASLRSKYNELKASLDNFVFIEKQIAPSNIEAFTQYQKDIATYNAALKEIYDIWTYNTQIKSKIDSLQKQISEFQLIEDKTIPGQIWNEELYNQYLQDDKNYALYVNSKENTEKQILDLKKKIKDLSTKPIEDKISKYKEVELMFIESIHSQLTVGDVKFIFYKTNTSPNAIEPYSAVFDIEYKWKMYDQLSWGEQVVVDVVIATLFLSKSTLDFILLDNAEISNENLKMLHDEYLNGIQLITTRISNKELNLTHKI